MSRNQVWFSAAIEHIRERISIHREEKLVVCTDTTIRIQQTMDSVKWSLNAEDCPKWVTHFNLESTALALDAGLSSKHLAKMFKRREIWRALDLQVWDKFGWKKVMFVQLLINFSLFEFLQLQKMGTYLLIFSGTDKSHVKWRSSARVGATTQYGGRMGHLTILTKNFLHPYLKNLCYFINSKQKALKCHRIMNHFFCKFPI